MSRSAAPCLRPYPGIDPRAVVDDGAELGPDVAVGPFAVIGAGVRVGAGTAIGAHAVLQGDLALGEENWVGPHAVLGGPPQIRGLDRAGALRIGSRNVIRELATVHAGQPGGETRLGNGCLLMVGSHVAHDCQIGNQVELANGVQLAGHVVVGDHASLGGLAGVHQLARIGAHSFVGAGAMVAQDVLPFTLVSGNRARTYGINAVGLRRRGFAAPLRSEIATALRELLGAATLREGIARALADHAACEEVRLLCAFAESSKRGLCRPVSSALAPGEDH